MANFANPDFGQFRLGESMAQGQQLAAGSFRLNDLQRTEQARTNLEQALRTGTPEAMQQFGQINPIEARLYQQQQQDVITKQKEAAAKLDADQLSAVSNKIEFGTQLLYGLKDATPSPQSEEAYQQAKMMAQKAQLDTSTWPQNFDPIFVKTTIGHGISFKQILEEQKNAREERTLAETKRKNLVEERLKAREIGAGGKPPAGYRATPEGGLVPIPGGPADPKNKSAKMSDTEMTAAGYATRMAKAEEIMSTVPSGEQKPGVGESMAATLPLIGKVLSNTARSDERQKYRQAQEDWVRSKLRKESGAVIADEEMDREIRVYFPQLGDSDAVIAQKAAARQVAIEAMQKASGPSYVPPEKVRSIGALPNTNAKGWVLHQDAQGNKAYVGPNGQIEEVP